MTKKSAEPNKLTPETIHRAFELHDPAAMNEVADAVIRMVGAAMERLEIRQKYGWDVAQDFRSQVLTKLFDYSLERFNPENAQLSTFVFTHVGNHWKNYQNRLIKQLQRERSMDEPTTEEGMPLSEMLADPHALDFISAQEAAGMYKELQEGLVKRVPRKENIPKYQEILRLWVDDTALNEELAALGEPIAEQARNALQKSEDIAKVVNVKFPETTPIGPVRVQRVIHDTVKNLVKEKFPEEAAWAESKFQPSVEEQEQAPAGTEEEEYIPLEERPAPIYRIDPETGERTQISLNLRRRKVLASVRYAHNVWFATVMTWLGLELNGKL